jgi:phosphate transport system substrate-binding protein
MSRKWRRSALALFAMLAMLATACGGGDEAGSAGEGAGTEAAAGGGGSEAGSGSGGGEELSGDIQIDGSSTVAPLSETAAELFQEEHPGVRVTVGTSGTGGGFERFCAGETDVSNASRPIAEDEISTCEENGVEYEEVTVANDALSVVVNPNADFVDCLTVEQLTAIWEPGSTITNWNQIPGGDFPDLPLQLFGAGTDSGTFDYFTEAINGEEGASRTDYNATEDDNVTVQGVGGSEGGLGYLGFSYVEENAGTLKALAIDNGDGCVEPSEQAVQDGTYTPLGRPLFIYPSGEALQRPEGLEFLKFYIENNAEIAETALFIPLTSEQEEESLQKVESLAGGGSSGASGSEATASES